MDVAPWQFYWRASCVLLSLLCDYVIKRTFSRIECFGSVKQKLPARYSLAAQALVDWWARLDLRWAGPAILCKLKLTEHSQWHHNISGDPWLVNLTHRDSHKGVPVFCFEKKVNHARLKVPDLSQGVWGKAMSAWPIQTVTMGKGTLWDVVWPKHDQEPRFTCLEEVYLSSKWDLIAKKIWPWKPKFGQEHRSTWQLHLGSKSGWELRSNSPANNLGHGNQFGEEPRSTWHVDPSFQIHVGAQPWKMQLQTSIMEWEPRSTWQEDLGFKPRFTYLEEVAMKGSLRRRTQVYLEGRSGIPLTG